MKVALCLSGHMRSYESTFQSMRNNIIDPLNADVFIHTWDRIGLSPGIDLNLMNITTESVKSKIEEYFKPIKLIIEPIVIGAGEIYRSRLVDKRCPNGIVNMFMKTYKVNNLMQQYENDNNFKYDVIIRTRPDLLFNKPIDNNELQNCINDNCLYLPNFGHYDGLNDQFSFANNNVMKLYCECYSNLPNFYMKTLFKPEPLLKQHCLDSKIDLKFSSVDYFLRRSNGENFDNKKWANGPPDLRGWWK